MIWEAAFWSALALLLPAALEAAPPRLSALSKDRTKLLEAAVSWGSGLVLPYLAVVTGAVLGRDAGLYGLSAADWLRGGALCLLVLAAGAIVRWRRPSFPPDVPALEAALDEPRWALYRAAGILWTGALWAGVLIGLGGAVLECASVAGLRRMRAGLASSPGARLRPDWSLPVRAVLSAALFAATRSFWLTAACQLGLLALARWRPRPEGA